MDRQPIAVELVTVWNGARDGGNGGVLLVRPDVVQPSPTRRTPAPGEQRAAVERALASGRALRLSQVASAAGLDNQTASNTLTTLRRRGRVVAEGVVRGMRYRLVAEGEA